MLFERWLDGSTATADGRATTSVRRGSSTPTLFLEKTEPTIDVLGTATRIVNAATRHCHADHENAHGHHDNGSNHRDEEVKVEPFGDQMGQIGLAVGARTVGWWRQSAFIHTHTVIIHTQTQTHKQTIRR